MSENEKNSTLEAEVTRLETFIAETMQAREASLNRGGKIRAVVLVVVLIYFSFLYSLVAGFDADQALLMVRGQMDAGLPQMKIDTIQKMKAAAPEVVASYTQEVQRSIPSMRNRLERELLVATGDTISHLQAGLNDVFTELLKESKSELDKMGSEKGTADKLDRLSKEMRVKFHEESRAVVDGLAAQFSSTLLDVEKKVQHLQTSKTLNAKEKQQREMLRIWSKLMQIKMKDVNKTIQQETRNLAQ